MDRQRPRPTNISAVSRPNWTGEQMDTAVVVSRGEPRRTDVQMAAAIREQVRDYLATYPPRLPSNAEVAPAVLETVADQVAAELSELPGRNAILFREHLLLYLGVAIERVQRSRNEQTPAPHADPHPRIQP